MRVRCRAHRQRTAGHCHRHRVLNATGITVIERVEVRESHLDKPLTARHAPVWVHGRHVEIKVYGSRSRDELKRFSNDSADSHLYAPA